MRIVRYQLTEEDTELWPDSWGLLVDELVYPLAEAPYATLAANQYAPRVIGNPHPLEEVKLVAPVEPSKIVCVGRNYAAHAAELGNEAPPEPLIFLKPPSSLNGPGGEVVYPAISQRVDHEAELALVVGRRCRRLTEEEAAAAIFGYTIANDVTARDLQKADGQWTRGKGFDTFCAVGPWIDTAYDPRNRRVRCLVNNQVRQDASTADLIFSIGRILAHVTRFMTLEPGDLLLTGTPEGVSPVQPGDVMTVEIDGLGSLSNPVVTETSAS